MGTKKKDLIEKGSQMFCGKKEDRKPKKGMQVKWGEPQSSWKGASERQEGVDKSSRGSWTIQVSRVKDYSTVDFNSAMASLVESWVSVVYPGSS